MKKLYSVFFVAVSAIVLHSCSAGLRAYQRGDYHRASVLAVERLRSNPGNNRASEALKAAYPMAVEHTEREASLATLSGNAHRIEGNIALYERMNSLAEQILRTPAALRVIPNPRTFHDELNQTMLIVGSMFYEKGVEAMNAGTMESARAAVDFFGRTMRYSPGYRDVGRRLEEAIQAATLRVIVTRPFTNPRYQIDADWFYDRLMAEISANTRRNMVRFFTPEEAEALNMNAPHQVIVLDFADFTVGNSRSASDTKEFRRDSVRVGTTTVNGVRQDVFGTVKARFTTHRLEVVSAGVMTIRVMDGVSRRVLNQRAFPGRSVWYSEWATFNGDERALSRQQLALAGRRPLPVPPPQELFRSFASQLFAQASDYISAVYSRSN